MSANQNTGIDCPKKANVVIKKSTHEYCLTAEDDAEDHADDERHADRRAHQLERDRRALFDRVDRRLGIRHRIAEVAMHHLAEPA